MLRLVEASYSVYIRGSRGRGAGSPDQPPLENNKALGLFSNTDPDPLENHIATKPAFNVRPPFRWRADDCPFKWYLYPLSPPHQLKIKKKKKNVRVSPPLTNRSRSAHGIRFEFKFLSI